MTVCGVSIKSERVTIHKHLFISYVLSGFAWIVYYCGAVLRADVLATNPVSDLTVQLTLINGQTSAHSLDDAKELCCTRFVYRSHTRASMGLTRTHDAITCHRLVTRQSLKTKATTVYCDSVAGLIDSTGNRSLAISFFHIFFS